MISASILDHVLLSSGICDIFTVNVDAPIANSDHKSVKCIPKSAIQSTKFFKRTVFDFRHSHIANLLDCISAIDCRLLIDLDVDVNAKCDIFQQTLYECFSTCIPSVDVFVSSKDPPWLNPVLKHIITKRWEAFRSGNIAYYKMLSAKVKKIIINSKNSWAKRSCKSSKFLWQTTHCLLGSKETKSVNNLFLNYRDCYEAAADVNRVLCSVFQNSDDTHDSTLSHSNIDTPDWIFHITPRCVLQAFNKYDANKAYDSDLIPTCVYKIIIPFICEPLAHLYNLSVKTCTFPSPWKYSHVICVPKCPHPSIADIRPISLLPLCSKIFEKFVYNSMFDTFVRNFGSTQFGFRPHSSTTHALISLHDFVTSSLDRDDIGGVQIVSYDFSKAFDKVSHAIIIDSLTYCKFPTNFIDWTKSYLRMRMQRVRIGSVVSDVRTITSGVPQGSVLGPALFSVVVSSFSTLSNVAHVIKFADDITIVFPLFKNSSNDYILNEHDHFLSWASSKNLIVNKLKCKSLLVQSSRNIAFCTIPNTPFVNELKLLGVTFNSQFNFNSHISHVVKNCARKLFALRVVSKHLSSKDCITIYNALLLSVLEYCSPLFVGINSSNNSKLESIQNRAHKIIHGRNCTCNSFHSLYSRRLSAAVKLFLNCANNSSSLLFNIMPPKSKLRHNHYIQPLSRTSRRLNSFVPFVTNAINNFQ